MLVWAANIGVYLYRKLERFSRHGTSSRLRIIQTFAAFDALAAGSAGYFLHVPHQLAMQLLLQACLNVVATMWIMERPRNSRVGGLGAMVIVMLAPLYGLYDFDGDYYFSALLLVGQACFCAVLWFFAVKQEASINTQIELRQQTEQARQELAEAIVGKVRFFGAASHDLRQPVHAIGLYLAILQQLPLPPAAERAATGIFQPWKVLDDLLMQILDLARTSNGGLQVNPTQVEVGVLAHDVAYMLHPAAESKGIRVVVLAPPSAYVQADVSMLRRALSNLLDNAIKFSPAQGVVALVIRGRGDRWALEVRDAGIGIAPEHHEKVFDEFVQLDNPDRDRREGFGLGLSVVKAFVHAMSGTLEMRSAAGRGTCIRLLLPKCLAPSGAGKERVPAPLVEASPMQPLRFDCTWSAWLRSRGLVILLVEDDPLAGDAFCTVMQMFDLPLTLTDRAENALSVCHRAAVAVCDMRLPGQIRGLQLAQQLMQQGIPSIIMTGENPAGMLEQISNADVPMVKKPVVPQQLLDSLTALLRQRAADPDVFDIRRSACEGAGEQVD